MASAFNSSVLLSSVFGDHQLVYNIKNCKLLLVGSGGIGCEVIKNLILTGFCDITLIDLDTIDVSNLNRQFLFKKSHVGHSKAKVAGEVAKKRFSHPNENVDVKTIQNSIQSDEFDIEFYKSFTFVINALDNRAARSHVNRMCLSADVPLIESGSEGYFGQVFTIKRDVSSCYECDGQKQDQRTYASCTIRNTPSQPIHCIVWGKHLFSQLFGEDNADNDVSPDVNDPELINNQEISKEDDKKKDKSPSIRKWAQSINFKADMLLEKLFYTDIKYLLKMEKLWEKRRKPIPVSLEELKSLNGCEASTSSAMTNGNKQAGLKEQRIWSLKECFDFFSDSLDVLKDRAIKDGFLVWNKDDDPALNFVCAVANIRSHCFNIERKSKFDVKSMAGNIIPAISSTNSIVGGIIVLQAINFLRNISLEAENLSTETFKDQIKKSVKSCKQVFLRLVSLTAKNLLASYELFEPNPNCLICCTGRIPEIEITCSLEDQTMSDFIEQIIFKKLNFVCPDVQIDGEATIIWSKEDYDESTPEEKEIYKSKTLSRYPKVKDKARLKVYDLLQEYEMIITLIDEFVDPNENNGIFFKMNVINEGKLKPENDKDSDDELVEDDVNSEESESDDKISNNKNLIEVLDDDDLIITDEIINNSSNLSSVIECEHIENVSISSSNSDIEIINNEKRKLTNSDDEEINHPRKRRL